MGKPSQTNATSTTINPAQVAQQPYLNYGWGEAKNLYQNNPQSYYPGQTLPVWGTPEQITGYQSLYNNASNVNTNLTPAATGAYNTAVGGGYSGQYNPAYGGYAALAGGTSPVSQNYQTLQQAAQQGANSQLGAVSQYADPMVRYANQAGANSNLGLSQLGQTASGAYLNSNPYMAQMVQSAMDPVTRNYQTSVAPSLDAAASAAGRYGSGTQAGLVGAAQQHLGRSLADLSGNLYGQQYARERQAQDAAAQNYGQLYNSGLNLGMTGMQNAANIQNAAANQYFQGQTAAQQAANQYGAAQQTGLAGLSSGFNTGNQASLDALRMYPQFAQAQYIGPQGQIQAGTGIKSLEQQQIADQMARYYGEQQAPWKGLEQYSALIGQPAGGSKSETVPYFSNPIGGAISGIAGIGGMLGSLGLRI